MQQLVEWFKPGETAAELKRGAFLVVDDTRIPENMLRRDDSENADNPQVGNARDHQPDNPAQFGIVQAKAFSRVFRAASDGSEPASTAIQPSIVKAATQPLLGVDARSSVLP